MFYHSSAYFLIFINFIDTFFTLRVFCDLYTSRAERKGGYEAQRKYQYLRTYTEKFMTVIKKKDTLVPRIRIKQAVLKKTWFPSK